jgi:heavy metal translocating P-type ATPase
MVGLLVVGAPVVARTAIDMLRGRFASDIVAALAIITALAFAQPLAGLIVALMQTGGEALERWAEGRATAAVRALEDSAPRIAHRLRNGGAMEDITVAAIEPGDRCLVRPGEMVPCDGVVEGGNGELDLSRITGEPLPVVVVPGDAVRSGGVAIARPLTIRATARAKESLYARIVELVREAQAAKAPLQRLADRWAIWFTPLVLVACAVTYVFSGEAIRVLAVLVVATPCPLILAAPVAIIGGINRAARGRVIIRTGAALERLSDIDTIALDKTGTVTVGKPEVRAVQAISPLNEDAVLGAAASLEEHSSHPLARSVVRAAVTRGIPIIAAADAREDPGRGIEGRVDGRRIAIGSPRWIIDTVPGAALAVDALPSALPDETVALVTIDGTLAGTVRFADALRSELASFFAELRALGITHTVLLSGDRQDRVRHVAAALGVTDARGDLLPDEKVDALRELLQRRRRVAMIGDGVNDAPALSTATVGIALAAHGGGIAAQSADCVLLAENLGLVAHAIRIARRTMRIARQSIFVGVGLSTVAMVFAAFGLIAPVPGALIQEAIDVAVILNAIRAAA